MFLPINFLIYGLNDVYDIKSDKRNKNKDMLQGAKLKKSEIKQIKKLAIIFSVFFLFSSILIGRLENILLSTGLIILSIVYSVPPIRLKSKPILDSIFGSIGYFFPILLAFTTYNSLSNIPWQYAILIFPMIGNHAITTLRDTGCDKKANILTTGVFLGKRKTLVTALILYLISLLLIKDVFLASIIISSSLFIIITSFTDLKKGKYIFPLITSLFLAFNTTLIYFILKANLS